MTAATHSRAPWQHNIDHRPKGQSIEITNGNPTANPLAYVPHHGKFSEANARVITVAPELLKLVQKLLDAEPTQFASPQQYLAWAKLVARPIISKAVQS